MQFLINGSFDSVVSQAGAVKIDRVPLPVWCRPFVATVDDGTPLEKYGQTYHYDDGVMLTTKDLWNITRNPPIQKDVFIHSYSPAQTERLYKITSFGKDGMLWQLYVKTGCVYALYVAQENLHQTQILENPDELYPVPANHVILFDSWTYSPYVLTFEKFVETYIPSTEILKKMGCKI